MDNLLELATSRAWASHWIPNLMALVRSVSHIPGDIIECGSYRGGTAMAMALADPSKQVYAFDTFTGMPAVTDEDQHRAGDFGDVDFNEVVEAASHFPNLALAKGKFEETFPAHTALLPNSTVSALFLDCDLYESYKLALSTFWPLISSGGICILEDYGVTDCQGATKAIEEFFRPDQIELREHLYVVTK